MQHYGGIKICTYASEVEFDETRCQQFSLVVTAEVELDQNHFQHLFLNSYGSVLTAAAPCDLLHSSIMLG